MKAQEVELALEEVEKAGEEQAKFGKCLEKRKLLWFHYLSVQNLSYSTKCIFNSYWKMLHPCTVSGTDVAKDEEKTT